MKAKLEPGERLEKFLQRPDAAGQRDEPVTEIGHELFAIVHGGDDVELRHAAVAEFLFHQRGRDDADDLTARAHGCVGDHTHETDMAAAIDEPDTLRGKHRPELRGSLAMARVRPLRGAAIDADALHFARVSSAKRKGDRPVMSELRKLGHQYFSTWPTTRSVPVK